MAPEKKQSLHYNHTSPRESKADIKNSIAPIRLWKRGINSSSLWTAVSIEVYVVTLRTFWKSESVSSERPSSAFAMICQIRHGNCQRTSRSENIYQFERNIQVDTDKFGSKYDIYFHDVYLILRNIIRPLDFKIKDTQWCNRSTFVTSAKKQHLS